MSAAVVAPKFSVMNGANDTLQEQIAWVRAVMAHLGIVSANDLAKRAGVAPSTLQRPMSDPNWPNVLSGRTMDKIARLANLRPMEFPSKLGGLNEPEAVVYTYDAGEDALESGFDRAVRELCRGRHGRDPWLMRSHALEIAGILPGDVLIVDLNVQPTAKDIVCAQVYQWSHMRAETVFRIFEPPYILTNSLRHGTQKPLPVDGENVAIRGVVVSVMRRHPKSG
jgi:hypothetical protein